MPSPTPESIRGTKSPYYTQFHFLMASLLEASKQYVAAISYCDSAIAHAPKSEGAKECHNLRGSITDPVIQMATSCLEAYPGQPSLQRMIGCFLLSKGRP